MNVEDLMGRWLSFYVEPGSAGMLVPVPGRARVCGEVIAVKPMANCQPGNVPTAAVTVRGRSGKTMVIDFSASFARVHGDQAAAVLACTPRDPALPPLVRKTLIGQIEGAQVWRCTDGSTLILP
jgi:hypothetical protein